MGLNRNLGAIAPHIPILDESAGPRLEQSVRTASLLCVHAKSKLALNVLFIKQLTVVSFPIINKVKKILYVETDLLHFFYDATICHILFRGNMC